MRICVLASSRFPVAEPFSGGLESWTHGFVTRLAERGHDVTLFAGPGSDPALPVRLLPLSTFEPSEQAQRDANALPRDWMRDHHAYLAILLALAAGEHGPVDVVHNISLHHLPLAMATALPAPLVTTLHTPPVAWIESALALGRDPGALVAVSRSTARSWAHVATPTVIANGVDVRRFAPGAGGGPAVWSGRLVPEKAPHLAIDAARRAGVPLVLAGPANDRGYWRAEVEPRLGGTVSYAGHLRRDELAALLGDASVAVVTPAWEEPYGLVAAEAMACGTPVAAFARGALPDLVAPEAGRLARPDDVEDLAAAVVAATRCDRAAVRAHAVAHCSVDRMVGEYERLYLALQRRRAA